MYNATDQEAHQPIPGLCDGGRGRLSAGHGDSTWVRQCMEWCPPAAEHFLETANLSRTVDTSEHVTGEVLAVACV